MLFDIVVMFYNVLTMFVVLGAIAGGVGISAEGPGGVPTALTLGLPPRPASV